MTVLCVSDGLSLDPPPLCLKPADQTVMEPTEPNDAAPGPGGFGRAATAGSVAWTLRAFVRGRTAVRSLERAGRARFGAKGMELKGCAGPAGLGDWKNHEESWEVGRWECVFFLVFKVKKTPRWER